MQEVTLSPVYEFIQRHTTHSTHLLNQLRDQLGDKSCGCVPYAKAESPYQYTVINAVKCIKFVVQDFYLS